MTSGIVRRHHGRVGAVDLQQRQQQGSGGGAAGERRQAVEEDAPGEGRMGVFVIELDDPPIHVYLPKLQASEDEVGRWGCLGNTGQRQDSTEPGLMI